MDQLTATQAKKIYSFANSAKDGVANIIMESLLGSVRLHASFKKTNMQYDLDNIDSQVIKVDSFELAKIVGKKLRTLGYRVKIRKKPSSLKIFW